MNEGQHIGITRHAIERFTERYRKVYGNVPPDPERTLRKLLARARPEDISPVERVKRLINHKEPTVYAVAEGWRFVLTEDGGCLLTVERTKSWQN